jgi:hypothetical protein
LKKIEEEVKEERNKERKKKSLIGQLVRPID